ncbi:M15 family metallopeptidase [Micromonospora sp. WMMD1102]|uniref:M15 family metallopeptidase n=1 Tax=Micromonospora sp. WMMD1102 TaxID=3016105 RepID=UPI002414D656|nr:M15 family metallopeptidase [Micromonospora sp. WMMD1102]MDG4788821.1 M15 family metallopeptidase [Micromonospora sp. WMMD1102]
MERGARRMLPVGPLSGLPVGPLVGPPVRLLVGLLLTVLVVASCGGPPSGERSTAGTGPTASPPGAPDGPAPAFTHDVSTVGATELGPSWRPGCPVGPDQLRRIRLGYWDFEGRPQLGTIVVHRSVTAEVVEIFGTLYRERFPIRRLQPVDAYAGSDDRSMADDNTSGFNCRRAVSTGPAKWSAHAYGKAIDVNPVENPYLLDGRVLPPAGAAYRDRSESRPGMAVPGGTLVEAFAAAGWQWGGTWRSPDYQHFTRTGG